MNTDRTQPARPAALNDRSSAAPAERRPEGAFAALLDAVAPAPRREEPKAPRTDVRDRGPEPRDAAPRHDQPSGTAAQSDAGSQEQPQAEQPVALAAPVAEPVAAPVAPPVAAAAPAPAAPALPTAPLFMLAPEAMVAAPVAPAAPALPTAPLPTEAATPAAPAPLPGAPVLPAAPAPAQPTVAAAPAEQAPTGLPALDAAPVAPQAPASAPKPAAPEANKPAAPAFQIAEAQVTPEAPAAHEAPAAAPARAAATAEPAPAAAPAAQAPAAEPVAPAPVPTQAQGLAAPERTVPLHRAPAAVGTLLHVAVERGISRAKMALRPVELGGIEIRLQATAGGIAAQVVADSPEAARLLAQAGDDLRRALEARDVTLISLEVSTSGDQQQQSARGEWSDGDDAAFAGAGRSSSGDAEGDAEPGPITHTVIELPGGLLVDVLA